MPVNWGIISETDLMWQETGVDPPPYIMFLDSVIYLKIPPNMSVTSIRHWGKPVGELFATSLFPDKPLKKPPVDA